ncbi:RNA 2',3'-cyclic phosphodiesterase [Alteromonas lipotrueiana]|uniref:RNA 2',3'-cyclic phosphodiesterase n=1 Tax=Alteromonas lipotrueiana TaxID=2803815 RepID=UPI001C451044|nr:RNA 2',3'-cyclic phosphodiesterase [Alteromonas lipotrueiana]
MNMRCFVGLDLSVRNKLALDDWRRKALPDLTPLASGRDERGQREPGSYKKVAKTGGKKSAVAVPAANFHLTLAFLGNVEARQHETLINALDDIQQTPVSLSLDSTGWWAGPKILHCAPSNVPDNLIELVRQVKKAARAAGIQTEQRPYQPHVTIARKATDNMPPPLFTPQIECHFTQFHLFESFSSSGSVAYPIRKSWRLTENLTVRERLRRGLE